MKPRLVLLLAACSCWAAEPDPTRVFLALRESVLARVHKLPNYTCVQTVSRDYFQPTLTRAPRSCTDLNARKAAHAYELQHTSTDRLRLDVAVAEDREMYSWVGASRFEDRDLGELVGNGPIGTGGFGSLLAGIFGGDAGRFVHVGDTQEGGRQLMAFSFTVPESNSHYEIRAGQKWITTGYQGTILVDPASLELVELTVRTNALPASTGSCETTTTMRFRGVDLGGSQFLLPEQVRQRFVIRSGFETENTVSFAGCREYRGESTVSFGDISENAPTKIAAGNAMRIPAGLPVMVELTSAVDSDRAAAGDPVLGRLAKPVRDKRGSLLAPAGAVVSGRLIRVEQFHTTPPRVTIALRLETVNVNGVPVPMTLLPDRSQPAGTTVPKNALRRRGAEIAETPLPGGSKLGVYHFSGEHATMPAGFQTVWTTAP